MHLLVSFQHVRPPSRAGLGLFDPATGRFRMALELPEGGARCDGFGGLTRSARMLYVATAPFRHLGEADPSLLLLRPDDLMPEARYRMVGLSDLRGLVYQDRTLWVLSGGTGEVVAFRAEGDRIDPDERFTWRPRIAVEGKADPALASLTFFNNELFASGSDRSSFDAFVFNVTRDSVAARGLQDPQSLAILGGHLSFAAGRFGAVHRFGPEFSIDRSAGIEGTVRGLCEADGSAFAASMVDGRCLIHRLSVADLTIEESVPLPVEGVEVASLKAVEGAGAWPDPPESIWSETFGESI